MRSHVRNFDIFLRQNYSFLKKMVWDYFDCFNDTKQEVILNHNSTLFFTKILLVFSFDNDADITRMRWLDQLWKILHTYIICEKGPEKAGNFHQIFSSIREIKEKRIYMWVCGRGRREVAGTFCRYAWITRGTSLLNSP